MDAIQLVPKSYPTGERRQKDKSREVNYSGSRGIRIHWLSLACRLLNQQYHTSWAGRCVAVRKVRSFWFQARVSQSFRRSHLVCDWWNVPGAEHLKGIKELGVCYLPGLGRGLPQLRSHRSPNLCWSPGCCPSRQPEGKQSSSRAQSLVFADKEGIEGIRLTRQCSFPWFSQWPVLPVRMILCSWLVFTQMISSTRSYLKKATRSNQGKYDHPGLDRSQNTTGQTYPQRLRHSRPSSIALSE